MSGFTRMCGEEGGPPLHLGYLSRTMGADEFHAFVQTEFARWGAIVKASGAKAD